MGTCFLLASCDSRITGTRLYSSPNGTRSVTVIEELQGANDPAPWWTHVSLREGRDKSAMIPGNLIKLEGRGAVTAAWSGDQEVTIFVDDALSHRCLLPRLRSKESRSDSARRAPELLQTAKRTVVDNRVSVPS